MLKVLSRMLPSVSVCPRRPLGRPAALSISVTGAAMALGLVLSGCSSGSGPGVKAGPIAIAGGTGQVSALAVASTLQLSMMPTGDNLNAGVDWTVTCGGNPITGSITNGSCGTMTPMHTTDGAATVFTAPSAVPIGAAITITAGATSSPAQTSSLSLTIVALPISVKLGTTPTSLQVSKTASLFAQVTNDLAGGGVIWAATCSSVACGTFNPVISPSQSGTTVYTAPAVAPADGTVTIAATSLTDTTKSVSAVVTITTPVIAPSLVAVSVLPVNLYVQTVAGTAHTGRLVAIVSNDSTNAGADWTLICGASTASACGSITAHTASGAAATFTAPSTIPPDGAVTIAAKSTADPTKSTSVTANFVTTAPVIVTMTSTLPATLKGGVQITLTAIASTGSTGIDWTATCGSGGACGTFNLSPAHTASGGQIVYTAPTTVPMGGTVVITASSTASTPSNPASAVTTILAPLPALSFTQIPPAALVSEMQAPVSVAVSNDASPGGVTWTAQCGSTVPGGCGWFAPSQTSSGATAVYTAPPVTSAGTSVTLKATSVADTTVSLSSTPIPINPSTSLSVHFVPSLPSQVPLDASVNLVAAVANDSTSAGVDWKVCESGCGFFTTTPAIPAIPATGTTPFVPAVPAVTTTSVSGWSNSLPIPYTAPSQPPSSGVVGVLASAHADATIAMSGTIAIGFDSTGPALNGTVQAGVQPVVGAVVALYAAGTSGYGSASFQVGSTATADKNGGFTVPAGFVCPSPDNQMYLVATGGKVGTNGTNPNLALMTALGNCNSLSSSPVVLNEVTTVASTWSVAPFAANNALLGNSSSLYIGTSSGNRVGLANAFAAVQNLVDISTGQARSRTPAGNAAVPYVEINTLADFLNACTATSGGVEGDGSACGTLFTATDVLANHALYNSVAPTNTLQAAFNMAQHPVSNYGYQVDTAPSTLFGMATQKSPFQPILTALPNDWSIALNYTSSGGLSSASMVGSFAIDAIGNLWVTDSKAGSVIEWNAVGAALSPATGFAAGGAPLAIDATGNVWVSGNGVLAELSSLGTPMPGSPFGGVSGGGGDIAIDAWSNLWISNSSGVNEFNLLGLQISPSAGFTNSGVSNLTAVGVDSSNNVWVGNSTSAGSRFAALTNPGGQLIVNSQSVVGVGVMPEIAADPAGNIWTTTVGGSVCKVPPYGGDGSELFPNCYDPSTDTWQHVSNPRGVALDGAGTVWFANKGGGTTTGGSANPPSIMPLSPSLTNGGANLVSSSLSAGPLRVAVDGSGNVWVLLADNTVTEYVGVATPVMTPIALGVKNKKLAVKP